MFPALAIVALLGAMTPAAPERWVTDETGQLAVAERAALDRELQAFEEASGHQVVVFVGRTTGGEPIEDWAVRTFEAWRLGRAKLDDGAALFVFVGDRAARIEVGYGLEERLTDAKSSRILREQLIPRMKAGDATGAVAGTARAIVAELSQGAPAPAIAADAPPKVQWYAMAIFAALFLVLLVVNPRAAFFLLMLVGRRRGGGAGGFHGGGGRSGGGGATGRW